VPLPLSSFDLVSAPSPHLRTPGQNPTDWKHIDTRSPPGAILGCDYTGRVAASADSGARDHIKVGTRVAGWVHGNLFPDRGAFAQYLKVPADLTFVVPDKVKPEEAAAFGIPYFTSFQGLHHSQKSGWPPVKESGKWVSLGLVWLRRGEER
jgi:NADPH:quinone reductase-like Zn-dependent oxidoreductase